MVQTENKVHVMKVCVAYRWMDGWMDG